MAKIIHCTKGFSLRMCLREEYPQVYQSLEAQGLWDMMDDRTNATVIEAVEAARKSNPLAAQMNEMAAKLKAINETAAMVEADAMSNALTKKCLKVLGISKYQFLEQFKGVLLRENPWQDFLNIFKPTLLPGDRYELKQQMTALSKHMKEHEDEARTRMQLARDINNFNIQYRFAPCGAAPYYFIEDGLRILEFDERFMTARILGPDDAGDGEFFRSSEDVQFSAFVNPSIVEKLMAEQDSDLMLDYIELIRQVESSKSSDLSQFSHLLAFLDAHPEL